MADAELYGLIAEFDSPERLIDAARRTRADGYRELDAFTPFPVEEMAEVLEFRDGRVLWFGLIGAVFGATLALAMQLFTNWDYPTNIGGRPVFALSAFAVVTFELTVLFGALAAALGMLALNRLPRLNHPVFGAPRIESASKDRFFLCVKARDPRFDKDATRRFLGALGADAVEEVPA
jgi:hypothetical protein